MQETTPEDPKPCRKCRVPLTEETANVKQFANGVYICRACDREQHKRAAERDPEKARQRRREWAAKNREKLRAKNADYRKRNRQEIRRRKRAAIQRDPEHFYAVRKEWATALKAEVMGHYAGGTPHCKCGFQDLRALTIDHIEGGGTEHRRQLNGGGTRFYQWLRSNGYPSGYQVLCMNCQFIKKVENREHGTKMSARNETASAEESVVTTGKD